MELRRSSGISKMYLPGLSLDIHPRRGPHPPNRSSRPTDPPSLWNPDLLDDYPASHRLSIPQDIRHIPRSSRQPTPAIPTLEAHKQHRRKIHPVQPSPPTRSMDLLPLDLPTKDKLSTAAYPLHVSATRKNPRKSNDGHLRKMRVQPKLQTPHILWPKMSRLCRISKTLHNTRNHTDPVLPEILAHSQPIIENVKPNRFPPLMIILYFLCSSEELVRHSLF